VATIVLYSLSTAIMGIERLSCCLFGGGVGAVGVVVVFDSCRYVDSCNVERRFVPFTNWEIEVSYDGNGGVLFCSHRSFLKTIALYVPMYFRSALRRLAHRI
jgi:hypothetical protein